MCVLCGVEAVVVAVSGCGWLWGVQGLGVGHACGCCCGWCGGGCVRKWWVGVLAVEGLTCCAPFACVLPPVFAVLLLLLPVGVSGAAALGWHGYCSGGLLLGVFLGTALLACVVTLPLVALETAERK